MYFWVMFWKWLFVISMIGFGILSVWVIVWGLGDIKSLLSTAKERCPDADTNNENGPV